LVYNYSINDIEVQNVQKEKEFKLRNRKNRSRKGSKNTRGEEKEND
jgi:hypothetical protein